MLGRDRATTQGYEMVHPEKTSEWLFIDPSFKDRFGHEGGTVIPGAGTKWTHLHRANHPGATQTEADSNAVSMGDGAPSPPS